MPRFIKKVNKDIDGFQVSVFDIDMSNQKEIEKLEGFIKSKIRGMRAHNKKGYLEQYLPPNLLTDYKDKLNNTLEDQNKLLVEEISQVLIPTVNKIKWFDVRRSRVTEFMSQLLLTKEFGCIFFDEADKRINLEPINIDKHVAGIDVTGLRKKDGKFKFVACEVKASKDPSIPCSSSDSLLKDANNSYLNNENRLSKEILNYIGDLTKVPINDELTEEILKFLISLIEKFSSHKELLKNVVIFPFLIRNNDDIINNENVDDFKEFKNDNFKDADIHGIIWSFNKDIDSFSIGIYDEVLSDVK